MSNLLERAGVAADAEKYVEFLAESTGGEATDELEAYIQFFNESKASLDEKLIGVKTKIDDFITIAERCADEARRAEARAKAFENKAKRLKEWALFCMAATNKTSITTPIYTFSIVQKKGKALYISENVELSDLEPRFIKSRPEIDKDAIRTALEAGEQLKFAALVPIKPQLRIA